MKTLFTPEKFPGKWHYLLYYTHNERERLILARTEKALYVTLAESVGDYGFRVVSHYYGQFIDVPAVVAKVWEKTRRRRIVENIGFQLTALLREEDWKRITLVPGFVYCSCVNEKTGDTSTAKVHRHRPCYGFGVLPTRCTWDELAAKHNPKFNIPAEYKTSDYKEFFLISSLGMNTGLAFTKAQDYTEGVLYGEPSQYAFFTGVEYPLPDMQPLIEKNRREWEERERRRKLVEQEGRIKDWRQKFSLLGLTADEQQAADSLILQWSAKDQ